jgi:lysozyme
VENGWGASPSGFSLILGRRAFTPMREGAMELSVAGLELLKQSEGFRGRVYLDAAGLPTIGWGHRLLHPESFPDGVTEDLAEHMLACDVDDAESAVLRLVKVPLTQGQFDALVDFVFNLGEGRLYGSTLLHDLNAGRYDEAAEQLLRWDHAGDVEVAGLKARREAEFALWHSLPSKDPARAQGVAA